MSAKAAGNQNTILSPRLQKKQASRSNSAVSSHGVKNEPVDDSKGDGKEGPEFTEPEVYPSLNMDDYPALVNQRSNTSLIPPSTAHQQGSSGFLSNPNWGGLNLGRDGGGGSGSSGLVPSMIGVQGTSSLSMENIPASSHSPQASPRMASPFSSSDQVIRSVDQSNLNAEVEQAIPGYGLNFPSTNLSADFLSAIRSASQFIQQQQQQQNYHPLQQQKQQILMDDKQSQPFQQHAQYNHQSHINRMLQQQQQHQSLQSAQQTHRPPHNFFSPSTFSQHLGQMGDGGSMNASSGNLPAQTGSTSIHGQNPLVPGVNSLISQLMKGQPQSPLGGLNMPPPPPQRGMSQPTLDNRKLGSATPSSVGYQASRVSSGSQSYATKPPGEKHSHYLIRKSHFAINNDH